MGFYSQQSLLVFAVYLFLALTLRSHVIAQGFFCSCNLKPAECDVNCCCDPDCTNQMKQFFSECTTTFTDPNSRACSRIEVNYPNFSPTNATVTSSDILCVQFDRYTQRNFYVNPTVDAGSAASVSAAIAANSPRYDFPAAAASRANYSQAGSQYLAGSTIEIITSSSLISSLKQPAPTGESALCSDASPATYLTSASFQCTRPVTSTACSASDSGISLGQFVSDFKVAPRPNLFAAGTRPNYTSAELLDFVSPSITCFNATGAIKACSGVPAPTLVANVCHHVLVKLTYELTVSPITGIESISYAAQLHDIDVTVPAAVQQNFTSAFSLNGGSSITSSSGNPGYLFDWPIRAAINSSSTNSSSSSSLQPVQLQLAAGSAAAAGACSLAAGGQLVLFGVDAAAACQWQLQVTAGSSSFSNCQQVNANIRQVLQLITNSPTVNNAIYIATYGNASLNSTADWTQLQLIDCQDVTSVASAGRCSNMLLAAQLRISFARFGSFNNVQYKIIGATLQCYSGDVFYQCTGNCRRTTQNFLSTFSVKFVDESPAVQEGVKLRPVFLARLPADFFYPLF